MSQKPSSNSDSGNKKYPDAGASSSGQTDKVSDAAAAYVHASYKTAMPSKRVIAGIPASKEVWRFAAEHGLIPHLETAVRLVYESFREVGETRFTYDIDPEIEEESYITIHAQVSGALDELVQEDWKYLEAIVRALPQDKLPLVSLSSEVA